MARKTISILKASLLISKTSARTVLTVHKIPIILGGANHKDS